MTEISARNFGLFIAYLIPGFLALWGFSLHSEPLRLLLLGHGVDGPTVGGVFYAVVAAMGAGMTLGAVRWLTIDTVHHATGLKRPAWSEPRIEDRFASFQNLVENHYRYYQFYANGLVALLLCHLAAQTADVAVPWWLHLGLVLTEFTLLAASRDALSRYYLRSEHLLNADERTSTMTNGNHSKERRDDKPAEATAKVQAKGATTEATNPKKTPKRGDTDSA